MRDEDEVSGPEFEAVLRSIVQSLQVVERHVAFEYF